MQSNMPNVGPPQSRGGGWETVRGQQGFGAWQAAPWAQQVGYSTTQRTLRTELPVWSRDNNA